MAPDHPEGGFDQLDDELMIEAIDLGGIDALEEDIVPCSCCGHNCNCE